VIEPMECGDAKLIQTSPDDTECSVYCKAAELLCSLQLNEVANAQHCANGCEDDEDNECEGEDVYNSEIAASESIARDCSSSATDTALIAHETCIDGEGHVLENDRLPSTDTGLKPDNIENNGATVPQQETVDDVTAKNRARHATADSSSSVGYYMASGHDVVFSGGIEYRPYGCEWHLHDIMELVSRDLSEPYSIYTYRYFIYNWPNLCFRVSLSSLD